jgi:hypothetical protein
MYIATPGFKGLIKGAKPGHSPEETEENHENVQRDCR